MTAKVTKTNRVRETVIPLAEAGTYARVTISVDPMLLKTVDRFAKNNKFSRSAIFEKALLLWYETLQEEADREFYSAETEDPEVASWSKVTSKTARYLWND
jgi:hypothetical protein